MSRRYRQGDETVFTRTSHHVLLDRDPRGVHFRCPCGHRPVYVTEPPHTITFDADKVLTLDGSVGSRASLHISDGQPNWCHFWIKEGLAEMASDARCPGARSPETAQDHTAGGPGAT